ncbi:MAG: hypothetical protein Q7S19_03650 [bacterium]|nr:hypothetical protein [bacterium]
MADKPPIFDPITDLKALLVLLMGAWLIWFSSGGPARYEATLQKPFLKTPTTREENGIWQDPFISEQYGSIPNLSISKVQPSTKPPKVEPLTKYGASSKLIVYLSKGQANSTGISYLKIDYPVFGKTPLKITGLYIKSFFGKGIAIASASDLPYQGRINEEVDLVINPGSIVYLIEGPSPLGVSFRTNKCIGILSQFQSFYPPLPLLTEDYAVQASQGLTYNSCIEAHRLDADFYNNEWRIYLNNKTKAWTETGDLIRLIDSSTGSNQTLTSVFY